MSNLQELTALVQQLVVSVASHADLLNSIGRNHKTTADSADSDVPGLTTVPAREMQTRAATSFMLRNLSKDIPLLTYAMVYEVAASISNQE